MDYEKTLLSLGFTLPAVPEPVATYVPAVRSGNLLFLSGMIPMVEGKMASVGKVGKELTVEQGQEAARITLLNALAVIKSEVGSLDYVERVVRIAVHVASGEGFTQQPAVANGASDLLVKIFGSAGRHARLALGAPVELEMIVQVKTDS